MAQQVTIPFPTGPQVMGGAYDAANRFDRSLASWQPPLRAADADILPDKNKIDARSLDAARNDAFVSSGVQFHKDSIVGSMFLLNIKPRLRALGLDEVWAKEFQEEVEAKFTTWAESPFNKWADASRRNTLTALVRLAVGTYVTGGEVLATAEWLREGDRPYRTCVQMVELSRLSNPQDHAFDRRRTRGGVRLSAQGVPLGYWIRRAAPGGFFDTPLAHRWSYIRARNSIGRPQVIHIVEQDRPSQTRGVSQIVSSLKEMRMTKRFRDVTLQNAVLNASFAASIESELPTAQAFEGVGGGDIASATVDYAQQFLAAVAVYGENARNMMIDGVRIPHLLPGTKLNLHPTATPNGVGSDFERALIRYLAADLGVSFEQLSKDYSETNYSSARAGMLETWKFMRSRKKGVADEFATIIFRLWFEEAVNAGQIESMLASVVPNLYEGLNLEAFCNCAWIGAGYGQIDEMKETQAAVMRIEKGLSTYEEEIGRFGRDWRETFEQRRREQEVMDEMGIEVVPPDGQQSDEENDQEDRDRDDRRRDERDS